MKAATVTNLADYRAARAKTVTRNPTPQAAREAEEARLDALAANHHYVGPKYVRGRPMAEVTRDIRKDIAAAIKARTLPAIKVLVKLHPDRGTRSVSITIDDAPFIIVNVDRLRWDAARYTAAERSSHGADATPSLRSDEATELFAKLEAIANAYNYDKSDTMTDYHDRGFYLSVDFGDIEGRQRETLRTSIDQFPRVILGCETTRVTDAVNAAAEQFMPEARALELARNYIVGVRDGEERDIVAAAATMIDNRKAHYALETTAPTDIVAQAMANAVRASLRWRQP